MKLIVMSITTAMLKPVIQEEGTGCGIAAVASVLAVPYVDCGD
jgi:hypothetical protein